MRRTTVTALAVAALLTGCTGGTSSEPATTPAGATSDATDMAEETEATQTSDPREGEPVVAQQVVPDVERPDDTATVGVQSLTVEGETMVLRLVVTPDFASVGDSEAVPLGEVFNPSLFFGVSLRLIDRENLKEYSVISEGNRWWATGQRDVEALRGEPMYAYAVFAAPEDDIEVVDVVLREDYPVLPDVPITR
ncbi:hypothetical protein [Oerskovia flava]|uniref:hypothetical protein n=1 Tax=Oerskovia flava TaxID=2986422 RepID=UPI00223F164C|nr:hypothetical protein [Oerskovia sp. JB1-3-2]